VNAAFLLVTSALLVGQAGDKKAPTPAPATPAPAVASSCGPTCGDCGCETTHKLRDRLRSMFSKCDSCDACKPTCHEHKPVCAPVKTTCDACERPGLLSKLRERFHRHDSCCDGGCGAPAAAPAKTEPIPAPGKKMPDAPKGKAVDIRIENAPAPNTITVAPAAPIVEVTPVPAPRVDADRRDPF
jgi:hypothetical protein